MVSKNLTELLSNPTLARKSITFMKETLTTRTGPSNSTDTGQTPRNRPSTTQGCMLKNHTLPGARYTICQKTNFLILKKTLTEYLDKSFIRINNSPAATPVFFVKKPGGNLRFCVDCRNFNRITKKKTPPLPLFYEIFRNIGKTKWYVTVRTQNSATLLTKHTDEAPQLSTASVPTEFVTV